MEVARAGERSTSAGEVLGTIAASYPRLVEALRAAGVGEPIVYADLSAGGWRGSQLTRELRLQIEGAAAGDDVAAPFHTAGRGSLAHAGFIRAGINGESAGRGAAVGAADLADLLEAAAAEGAVRALVVVARVDVPWRREDAEALRILARRLRHVEVVVALDRRPPGGGWCGCAVRWVDAAPACESEGVVEPTLLGLVPGIVSERTLNAVTEAEGDRGPAVSLNGPWFLVDPAQRAAPAAASRFAYDRLHDVARKANDDALRAFAQYHGNNLYVDPAFLARSAWQRFEEGGAEIALAYMQRALDAAVFPDRPWVDVQLQGMRLAAGRYRDLAGAPDPSGGYPDDVRGFLIGAKGWGLVMTGEAGEARRYLETACTLVDAPRERLYLLNILALSFFRTGALDEALALETTIRAERTQLDDADDALEYVNEMNIARIHERQGRLPEARAAYAAAFATVRGARADGDAIYANLCIARVDQDARSIPEAAAGYLRAGLHLVSSRVPQALPKRVLGRLLDGSPPPGNDAVEVAAASLAERLLEQWGDPGPASAAEAPAFARLEAGARPDDGWVRGGWGWSVAGGTGSGMVAGDPDGSCSNLRSVIHRILVRRSGEPLIAGATVLLVDTTAPGEIAGTPLELVEVAIRRGILDVSFEGEPVALTREAARRIEQSSRLRVHPAVRSLTDEAAGTVVEFRRDRIRPAAVTGLEADATHAARKGETVLQHFARTGGAYASIEELVRTLRRLEAQRILCLEVTKEGCAEAGLRLPSSVSS